MSLNRVAIVGYGVVSPVGQNVAEMMHNLEAGMCATRRMPDWNRYGTLRCQVGCPAELRDPKAIPRQLRRTMSRMSIFACQAAVQALHMGGMTMEQVAGNEQIGCVMGSTTGSPETITNSYKTLFSEHDYTLLGAAEFFRVVSHTVALNVAQYLGLRGMVTSTSAACASGLQAIGAAFDLVRIGRQEMVLCGGGEELHETTVGTFDILQAASSKYNDSPSQTPRPFDAARDGLVVGEGAGVILLEDYDRARQRGAAILAEVLGYHTCSNGIHVSQSEATSMATCMRRALAEAKFDPEQIGYVSAHATGTLQGDAAEAKAIGEVFGSATPLSSLKGHMGHTLGASGAIELAACVEMMRRSVICPTLHLEEVDEACAGINHVRQVQGHAFDAFLKNSFAFGGINAAVVCATTR